jgi:methylmalonyl-CoA mutase
MTASTTQATAAEWRAQVDRELARTPGASFDKTLVHTTPEGIAVQPLYTEAVAGAAGLVRRGPGLTTARVVTRLPPDATEAEVAAEVAGGVDGLWLSGGGTALTALRAIGQAERPFLVLDVEPSALEYTSFFPKAILAVNAITELSSFKEPLREGVTALVSTVPYHEAGGDAADELGIALATGRAYLARLLEIGMQMDMAMRAISFRVTVGRDTFAELCKLRALRFGWSKLLRAAGVAIPVPPRVHAVSATRTLSQRDPWVNLLRVTTQTFAAICGGADFVTPATFDAALVAGDGGVAASPLGRRVARNTGLVLRDESFLGRVEDPAGGSYFFEALTVELARRGWARFQQIEKDGGIVTALSSGSLAARLAKSWDERLASVARRKIPILGVSEFANLGETLPERLPHGEPRPSFASLPQHRDAEVFEALRDRAEAASTRPEALLVTVGPFADSRGRVGFARQLFAAGGISCRETAEAPPAPVAVACLCGSDESYAAEAVERARALKALGCSRILLAGRPGALEAPLREAGVDGFVYMGCDVVAVLTDVLSAAAPASVA